MSGEMDCKMEVLSFAFFLFFWLRYTEFINKSYSTTQLSLITAPKNFGGNIDASTVHSPEFFVFKAYLLSSWAAVLACLLIQPNWQLELVNLLCHTLMLSRIMLFPQLGYWLLPLIASKKYLLSPSITMLSNFSSWAIKSANWIAFASAISGFK